MVRESHPGVSNGDGGKGNRKNHIDSSQRLGLADGLDTEGKRKESLDN